MKRRDSPRFSLGHSSQNQWLEPKPEPVCSNGCRIRDLWLAFAPPTLSPPHGGAVLPWRRVSLEQHSTTPWCSISRMVRCYVMWTTTRIVGRYPYWELGHICSGLRFVATRWSGWISGERSQVLRSIFRLRNYTHMFLSIERMFMNHLWGKSSGICLNWRW